MAVKLVFGCPSYGPMEPDAVRSQRTAIMHAAGCGYHWVGDASPNRMAWSAARNAVVAEAMKTEADYICWADSDVILPPDAFTALLHTGLDFVTGIYFQRMLPHWPLIAHYMPPPKDSFAWFTDWPADVVAPIDGCGFGCVITSMKMLRAMDAPWFKYEKFSEDFDFCRKATKAGFKLFVNTSVVCGHLADPKPITIDHFRESHAKGLTSPIAQEA